ncbi:MAG: hypothetical protein JKY24_06115 [Pseudomonadales bacterium]|nr:hypothetical protein [Pseudomonadales bacterium]
MTDEIAAVAVKEPDVFSRGGLKLTYDLIRKKNARLALDLLNILGGEPIPKEPDDVDNKHSDEFRVDLDSFQVRAVVEALMEYQEADPGVAIMAKTLIEDWTALAHKMVAELPDDQKPPTMQ